MVLATLALAGLALAQGGWRAQARLAGELAPAWEPARAAGDSEVREGWAAAGGALAGLCCCGGPRRAPAREAGGGAPLDSGSELKV